MTLTPLCSGDATGYSIVVEDHATGTVVASESITSTTVQPVCFALPPGSYDVAATKSGCQGASWTSQPVTCGATTPLSASALCARGSIVFSVASTCGGALPGASIAISGPDTGTVTTGSDGKATYYSAKTGQFSATITHPSGRYAPLSYTFIKLNCTTTDDQVRFLGPAAGYVCCSGVTYPIKSTLHLTIGDGARVVTLGGQVVATSGSVNPVFIAGSPANCNGDAPLNFQLTVGCGGAAGVSVKIAWREINKYPPCNTSAAYVQFGASVAGAQGSSVSGFGSPTGSPPFAASGTVSPDLPTSSVLGDPTATTSWTLTE